MLKFHLTRSHPYAWCGGIASHRRAIRNFDQFRSLPHYLRCGACLRCYLAAQTSATTEPQKGPSPCAKN